MTELAVAHDSLRPLMFSIAYRMLGSVAEAEDVVQDAFVRMHESESAGTVMRSPDAFATTVTTRVALDALRSARRKRENYVGSWIPEPLLADDPDPAHRIEMDETVSIAFLIVLERLSPAERAVFLLREVFDYPFPLIAAAVDRSEAACRQLLARARRHVKEEQPRFEPSPKRRAELADAFFAAIGDGNVGALQKLLAEDAAVYGDGGGKAPARRTPVLGRIPAARFIMGLARQAVRDHWRVERVDVNGQPGARVVTAQGHVVGVFVLDIADGHVQALRNQINPDKLRHLEGWADGLGPAQ